MAGHGADEGPALAIKYFDVAVIRSLKLLSMENIDIVNGKY